MLILEVGLGASRETAPPQLEGIEVIARDDQERNRHSLALVLKEPKNREIFHRVCLDILDATRHASEDSAAYLITITRLWRWHRLLKGGKNGKLSNSMQRGLIGELTFMSRLLYSAFGVSESIECWTGPLGEPKDFTLGASAVEVKTRGTAGRPAVTITSEHQLDHHDLRSLFLQIYALDKSPAENPNAFTLAGLVDSVRTLTASESPAAVEVLDTRLMELGYFDEDDYSEPHWEVGVAETYLVTDAFPRITPSMTKTGVVDVRYRIDLAHCREHLTTEQEMIVALQGADS